MLTVKTLVKNSEIEGLGLFAAEKIPKGTVIWKFNPRFDIYFDPGEIKEMNPLQQEFIDRYAYLSTMTRKYVLCTDDARFMNHSASKSNIDITHFTGEPETRAIAKKDIELGEEILVNYREIDSHDTDSTDEYLEK